MKTIPTGTRVIFSDPEYGTWKGRVVVCLCKRHVYQPALGGRECWCGYPVRRDACRIPLHVVWDDVDAESHESPYALREA
jgi:hypothetical protein